MKKNMLAMVVFIAQPVDFFAVSWAKGDRRAEISGSKISRALKGPLIVSHAPSITFLEELGLDKKGASDPDTEVRYELLINNQYQHEDNRHKRMPFLTKKMTHPFDYTQSTNAIYLYVPNEQYGKFTLKRTTIEYIPVTIKVSGVQQEEPEDIPVLNLRPGDSYTLRRSLPEGYYYTYKKGVTHFFPGKMFTIPQDWNNTLFKIYVGRPGEKTNRVGYVVYVKQPKTHMIPIRRNERTDSVQISLAPGEELLLNRFVTLDNEEEQFHPRLAYSLSYGDYENEKVQPKIEKKIVRELLENGKEVTVTEWILSIPSRLKIKPLGAFSCGTFMVQQHMEIGESKKTPEPDPLPIMRVKIEPNKSV